MTTPDRLTAKQQCFVDEYLLDLNATQAAIRAGYSKRTARQAGAEQLSKPVIKSAIEAAQTERSKRTGITADAVLYRLWAIATADPRELVEYRRSCCRYCWSINHEYQRTQSELDRDRSAWEAKQTKASKEEFNVQGGVGFNAKREPCETCPECFGDGLERVFVHDTRHYSAPALALYAGVKVTKDGHELKTQDQQLALIHVGKHLGMFDERPETPLSDEERIARIRAGVKAMDAATTEAAA